MTTIYASLENMVTYADKGLFAYSPDTGEECSADHRDYWHLGPTDVLEDENGRPMVLAARGGIRIAHHEDYEGSAQLISRDQAEEWARRKLSDAEFERLSDAIPFSSIPDAIDTIVNSWGDHDGDR